MEQNIWRLFISKRTCAKVRTSDLFLIIFIKNLEFVSSIH
jgi:hypothetical protein